MCEEAEVTKECVDCHKLLCTNCATKHEKNKKHHTKEKGAYSVCGEHSQKADFFCLDCSQTVCLYCINPHQLSNNTHSNHDFKHVKEVELMITKYFQPYSKIGIEIIETTKQHIDEKLKQFEDMKKQLDILEQDICNLKSDLDYLENGVNNISSFKIEEKFKLYEKIKGYNANVLIPQPPPKYPKGFKINGKYLNLTPGPATGPPPYPTGKIPKTKRVPSQQIPLNRPIYTVTPNFANIPAAPPSLPLNLRTTNFSVNFPPPPPPPGGMF